MRPYGDYNHGNDLSVPNTITIDHPYLRDINDLVNKYLAKSLINVGRMSYLGQRIWMNVTSDTDTVEVCGNTSEGATNSEGINITLDSSHLASTKMEVDEPVLNDYSSSDSSESEMDFELVKEIQPTTTLHYFPNENATRGVRKHMLNLGSTILKFQGNLIVLNPRSGRMNSIGLNDPVIFTIKKASDIYFDDEFRYEAFQHDGYHEYLPKVIYRYPKTELEHGMVTVIFLLKHYPKALPSAQMTMFLKPFSNLAIHVDEI